MKLLTTIMAISAITALSACESVKQVDSGKKAENRAACLSQGLSEESDEFISCMMSLEQAQEGSKAQEDMRKKLEAEREIRDKLKEHERYKPYRF